MFPSSLWAAIVSFGAACGMEASGTGAASAGNASSPTTLRPARGVLAVLMFSP